MTGFRRTADSACRVPHAAPGLDREPAVGSIPEQVIEGLTAGRTPRMVARRLELPLDLVLLIVEQARARGELDFFELRTANCSAGASCDPDPDSLVCAGCPLLPGRSLSARKKHTVTFAARVRRALTGG